MEFVLLVQSKLSRALQAHRSNKLDKHEKSDCKG